MKKPFFTIAIPAYNRLNYLKDAVNSVLNQSFEDFELLIIDDGSQENIWDYLLSIKDKRVRVLRNPKNIGIVKNWIRCIEEAKGTWFKFLLSDDVLFYDSLAILNKLIINFPDNFVIVTSGIDFTDINEVKNYLISSKREVKDLNKYLISIHTIISRRKRFIQTWANPNAYTLLAQDLKELIQTSNFKKVLNELGDTGHCVDYYILYAVAIKYRTMIEADVPLYGTRYHETNFSKTYSQNLLYHLRGDKFVHYLLYNYKGIENMYIIKHAFKIYFNKLWSDKRSIISLSFFKKTIQLLIFLFEHIFKLRVKPKIV